MNRRNGGGGGRNSGYHGYTVPLGLQGRDEAGLALRSLRRADALAGDPHRPADLAHGTLPVAGQEDGPDALFMEPRGPRKHNHQIMEEEQNKRNGSLFAEQIRENGWALKRAFFFLDDNFFYLKAKSSMGQRLVFLIIFFFFLSFFSGWESQFRLQSLVNLATGWRYLNRRTPLF